MVHLARLSSYACCPTRTWPRTSFALAHSWLVHSWLAFSETLTLRGRWALVVIGNGSGQHIRDRKPANMPYPVSKWFLVYGHALKRATVSRLRPVDPAAGSSSLRTAYQAFVQYDTDLPSSGTSNGAILGPDEGQNISVSFGSLDIDSRTDKVCIVATRLCLLVCRLPASPRLARP